MILAIVHTAQRQNVLESDGRILLKLCAMNTKGCVDKCGQHYLAVLLYIHFKSHYFLLLLLYVDLVRIYKVYKELPKHIGFQWQ